MVSACCDQYQKTSTAGRRGRRASGSDMASERQRSERLRHSERRGVTSSEAAAQRDAIGLVVIREAGHRDKVETKSQDQQGHRKCKEGGRSPLPAAQVGTCVHQCPPAKNRQGRGCAMLVVWWKQPNSRSPPAPLSEVAKAARLYDAGDARGESFYQR